MVTPKEEALNKSSFMMKPEYCSSVLHKMPKESVLCISACPISRIVVSYFANISVIEAVNPGRSSPVILIRISSASVACIKLLYLFLLYNIATKIEKIAVFYAK